MSVVLIRSLILYIVVIFGVRLMGKRQLGELQPSELVITILISNIATLPLEDTSIPLVLGILPILTLVCFEVVISWVTLKSLRMRRIISGRPKIIVRNGQIEQATMRDLRLSAGVRHQPGAVRRDGNHGNSLRLPQGGVSAADAGGRCTEKSSPGSSGGCDTGRLCHEQTPGDAGEKPGVAGTKAGGASAQRKRGVPHAQ